MCIFRVLVHRPRVASERHMTDDDDDDSVLGRCAASGVLFFRNICV